jgi:hypothetical protein
MKNWTTQNIKSKTMIDRLKISIFERHGQNINVMGADFICNNKIELLMESILEIWLEFYLFQNSESQSSSIFNKFIQCTDIFDSPAIPRTHLYTHQSRYYFHDLLNELGNLQRANMSVSQIVPFSYNKKHNVPLEFDSQILMNKINTANYKIWENIRPYIPIEQSKYFLEFLYLIGQGKTSEQCSSLLSTIINKFSRKTKLLINIPTTNAVLKNHYLILLVEIVNWYQTKMKNLEFTNKFKLYQSIFNWNIKAGNIYKRIPLIFLMYESLFHTIRRQTITQSLHQSCHSHNLLILNIPEIQTIYDKLISFYELDSDPKTNIQVKGNSRSKDKSTTNNNNSAKTDKTSKKEVVQKKRLKSLDNLKYLYTICNINQKNAREKVTKIDLHQQRYHNSKHGINKPVNIEGDDKVCGNLFKYSVDVVKL